MMEIENLNQALAVIENSLKKIDSARVQVEKVTESGSGLSIETRKLAEEVKTVANIIKTETSSVISLFSETLNNLDIRIVSITEKSQDGILKGIDNFKTVVNNIETVSNKTITDIKTLSIDTIQKQEITNSKTLNSIYELLKIEVVSTITKLATEVDRLGETDFSSFFNDLQKNFIDNTGSDFDILLNKFNDRNDLFQTNINLFKDEITRLTNNNLTVLFGDLQKVFIDNTRADLEIELKKLDAKSEDIQSKITLLNNEIVRLEGIDLEKHFDKHQKTLSDIFGAINSINLTLTSISQGFSGIAQSISYVESSITNNFKETNQQIISLNKKISDELAVQKENVKNSIMLFDEKTSILQGENELLKKEIKTNRIILVVGFIAVLFTLFFIVKH